MKRQWISDLTRDRLKRFRKTKRSWYSLLILGTAFLLSLGSEFIANDKPLHLRYQGNSYFPVVKFYPASGFGGQY
nr:ABC transporter permease [Fibrobacterota bacterium]